jgi:hypothetical protein
MHIIILISGEPGDNIEIQPVVPTQVTQLSESSDSEDDQAVAAPALVQPATASASAIDIASDKYSQPVQPVLKFPPTTLMALRSPQLNEEELAKKLELSIH